MKLKSILFAAMICRSATPFAQPYFFSQQTVPYSELTGTTSINNSTVWSSFQSFSVPIGFNFEFMGNSYSTIFIEGSGFARFDPSYYYLINPFTVALEDKGTSSSLSPLAYKLEGSSPSRVLKIEWNNCGYVNDASGIANFQLWLYETSNMIEVHIGTCNAIPSAYSGNGDTGPAIGIYKFSSGIYCEYGIGLLENPAVVNDSIIQNANADIFDFAVSSTPASGTVYRFTPGGVGLESNENNFTILIDQKQLVINSQNEFSAFIKLIVTDQTGRIILNEFISTPGSVDLNGLANGVYFCALISSEEILITKKISLVH